MGFGMTVISRRLASDRLRSGSLVEIHVADASLERQFNIVWHKNKYLGPSLQQLIDVCAQYGRSMED